MIRRPFLNRPEPWPRFRLLTIVLTVVSLVSALVLDHINARKGEPSFIFAAREMEETAAEPVSPLAEILAASLAESGVPEETVLLTRGPKGQPLFEIETTAGRYESVEPILERILAEAAVRVLDRKKTPGAETTEILWSVRSARKEDAGISFIMPAAVEAPVTVAKRKPAGRVALIVDDMGHSLDALDVLVGLGHPVTVAVLPYSPWASHTARIAHENGLEVLLHIPLESINNHEIMEDGDGTILSAMTPEEIRRSFETSWSRVPFARGVNNHTGSVFTAERAAMRALLGPIKDKGLFFVDSRTTARSVAYSEARKMGVPAAERDVFLDADDDRGRIRARLLELFQKAQKNGKAIGICHPYPETLETLKTTFRLFESYGLEVVPVSELVR
jgi:polysaccharide deacetylase 2 family uncharacterized protein YibQ